MRISIKEGHIPLLYMRMVMLITSVHNKFLIKMFTVEVASLRQIDLIQSDVASLKKQFDNLQ
ncbi:hypothetical protein FNV43_RR11073 [Rhamnella rubrinervis]|uniref:Uncharacterized protein n=1 Tax=Rhamnella rubrinervis TaxID=2594499 RepID=A0A8K0MHA7_9ROSA|nr:hypothetical protein FNV43_RR11073 [Rhamnella rubrinervis]